MRGGRRPDSERSRRAFYEEEPPEKKEEPDKNGFFTYCDQTSLHGWQYLAESVHVAWRVVWLIVVLISIAVAIFFAVSASLEFSDSTIITTIDSLNVPLSEVYFPAITVCNINQVRQSFFNDLNIGDQQSVHDLIFEQWYEGAEDKMTDEEINKLLEMFKGEGYLWRMFQGYAKEYPSYYDVNNQTQWQEILNDYDKKTELNLTAELDFTIFAVQNVTDKMILKAIFGREERLGNATDFVSWYGTDYGNCDLFFPQITFDSTYDNITNYFDKNFLGDKVERGVAVGKENGLSMLLDAQTFDYTYHLNAGEGFKLAVHHHLDKPIMSITEIDIKPGEIFQVAVKPTLIKTSNQSIHRFSPEERNCYDEGELPLKHFTAENNYRYGMNNCLFEAVIEKIFDDCDCMPSFHQDVWMDICTGTSLKCMLEIMHSIGKHSEIKTEDGEMMPCMASCQDQINEISVTSSDFPNRNTFEKRQEFCLVHNTMKTSCESPNKRTLVENRFPTLCENIDKIQVKAGGNLCLKDDEKNVAEKRGLDTDDQDWKDLVEDLFNYSKANLAVVNVYIKDASVTQIIRDEKISWISFIANVGGLMGLCMGFSLVSSWEIVYHFGLAIYKLFISKKSDKK